MLRPRLRPHPATLPSRHHANLRPVLLPPPLHLPSPLHLQRTGVRRRRLACVAPTFSLTSSTTAPGAATTSATSRGGTPRSFPTPCHIAVVTCRQSPFATLLPMDPSTRLSVSLLGSPPTSRPTPSAASGNALSEHRSPYNCSALRARLRVPEPPTPIPPSVPVANFPTADDSPSAPAIGHQGAKPVKCTSLVATRLEVARTRDRLA